MATCSMSSIGWGVGNSSFVTIAAGSRKASAARSVRNAGVGGCTPWMVGSVGMRAQRRGTVGGRRDHFASLLCPCSMSEEESNGGETTTASEDELLDEDVRAGLNEISTEALRVMLSEDDKLVEQFKEKIDYLGEYLVQDGLLESARFMFILRGMLDHEIYPEKDQLRGAYKKAFDTIAHLIEDSGWVLKQEGQDVGGVEMVDDELIPPVLKSQY